MKKSRIVAGLVAGLVVVGLSFPMANLMSSGRRVASVSGDATFTAVSGVLQAKCADCHAREVAKMPFYARLPLARDVIGKDQARAEHWWRMTAAKLEGAQPFDGADLGHLEVALAGGNMPPARYVALHWDSRLTEAERNLLLGWIRGRRAATPEAQQMAERHRGEAVQPVAMPTNVDDKKRLLGERLYHEVRLSGDDTVSCATCHALNKGGTDQLVTSRGIRGQMGPINAPTTLNAAYNVLQFWDGRAKDLKEQAGGPVENPKEMGAAFPDVVAKLQRDEVYVRDFETVFPGRGISEDTITEAIAEYERTLVTPGAPFDRYLAGDDAAIDDKAKAGAALFVSTGCAACHEGPAVGGSSFQRLGIAGDYFADRGNVGDADLGRYAVTHDERDRHSFKVPTLRNLAVTFPYFHDGSVKTIEDGVVKMAKYQRGRTLTDSEVAELAAFLRALTGTYAGTPVTEQRSP